MPLSKAQQFLAAGAFVQARREAERLLSEGGLTARQQGRAHHLASRASLMLKDLFGAVRSGEKALACGIETVDPVLELPVRFDLGCAYTQIGDGHLATEHLRAFLAEAPADPAWQPAVGTAYYNLSLLARQRKQWAQAIDLLRRAAELLEPARQSQAALDLAWCHLMLGRHDLAVTCLTRAEQLLLQEPCDHLMADLLFHRALCHRLRGELGASTALCQELFLPGRPATGSAALAHAAWIMGENGLDLGHPAEAMLFANLALDQAVKANLPSVMNLAGDLRRRIGAVTSSTKGNPDS